MNGSSQDDRHRGPDGIGTVAPLTGDLDVSGTDSPGPGAGTGRDEPQDPDDDQRDPHQSQQKGPATAHGAGCRLWVVPISTLTFGDVAGSGTTPEPRFLVSHRLPIHLPHPRPSGSAGMRTSVHHPTHDSMHSALPARLPDRYREPLLAPHPANITRTDGFTME